MKLQIKYFEKSNVNFRQNLNNFISSFWTKERPM